MCGLRSCVCSASVCLSELREAGAESVGTGDGFLSDSLSPTPSLIQTLRKALFVGRMGSQARASPVGTRFVVVGEIMLSIQELLSWSAL